MCDFQCSSYVLNFQIQRLFGSRELDNLRIEKKGHDWYVIWYGSTSQNTVRFELLNFAGVHEFIGGKD